MTVVGRYDHQDRRVYIDPLNPELEYLSVTTVLGATRSKPWLEAWAAKLAAEYAVGNVPLLQTIIDSEAGPAGAVDLIKGASRRARELKADVGSYVHDVVEALILDGDLPVIPEHLDGKSIEYGTDSAGKPLKETIDQEWLDRICTGFLNFTSDFAVVYEMAEATVVHPANGHAGTLDMIARLGRLRVGGHPARGLIDTKTGKNPGDDANEQMSAYRKSRWVWLDNLGNRDRLPEVDFCAVLHLRSYYERGYKVLEQPADDAAYDRFMRRLRVLKDAEDQPKVFGRPLYPSRPDGSQPAPLIEDVDEDGGFNRYRKPLLAVGIRSLDEVAVLTAEELLTVKGVGKAAIPAVKAVLAAHGLALAGEPVPQTQGAQ